MGLDSVELLWAVEEHFGIDITNDEANVIGTVGDLEAVIAAKLLARGESRPPGMLYEEVADLISFECGVERDAIRPDAEIVADLGID